MNITGSFFGGSFSLGMEDVFSIELSPNNVKLADLDISSMATSYNLSKEEQNELKKELTSLEANTGASMSLLDRITGSVLKAFMDKPVAYHKLVVDNILKADIIGDSQTAMHPVESAKNIIDHKFAQPRQINMTVLISKKDVGGFITFADDKESIIAECEKKLELWRKLPLLIKINSNNAKIYDNFLLKSYREVKSRENYACFEADLTFVEMQVVEPQKTTFAISSNTVKTGNSRTMKEV